MTSTGRERSGIVDQSKPKGLTLHVGPPINQTLLVDMTTFSLWENSQVQSALAKLDYTATDVDQIAAAAWMVARRVDNAITFEEIQRAITFQDVTDAMDLMLSETMLAPPNPLDPS